MSSYCYDQISRHGLTQVYHPAKDGDKPAAHIIFVHGLFGHPEKTWTGTKTSSKTAQRGSLPRSPAKSSPAPGVVEKEDVKKVDRSESRLDAVFWPAALLPKVVPNTKIWTWGYDADIDGFWSSASQNTVSQHATNLLSDVADLLETKHCNLPIIFVVHSLGGLIIKDAMNMSSAARGNRFKVVVPAVHGILFLGTPHRGSKSASIGRMAYQITKAAARRPNEKLLQALERNSDTLEQINNSFLQTLEEHQNIAISSFREEKETRKFLFFSTIVVEADSARIGLAREELNSIPADHRNMAKLSSLEDVGFKRASAQIRRWIQSLPMSLDDQDNQEYIDCVRSLDSQATKTRLKNVAASHSETLQWLFDSKIVSFSSWLQDSQDSLGPIYWVQGKPGSGKSTLMKFAMMDYRLSDLLQTSERLPYVIAGFFFHDRGIMVQKSMAGMLQELLHSILLKSSALRQFVQPIYATLVDAQKTRLPIWDIESLQLAFEAIMKQRQVVTRLCLFLDALDEHHGDNDHLASLMKKLVALADRTVVKAKLCLASRPWDTFVTSFGKCPGFKIHDHTYNDIRAYTLAEFIQSSSTEIEITSQKDARSAKLEALAVQVTEKAHGVFIWVRIVVEEIAKGLRARTPFFALEEKLAKMPEELKDLYQHTLERIEPDHVEESYVMLQIALCALLPLGLETFVNTTSHAVWQRVPDFGEELLDDMTQRIISRSGGLLEVIESSPEEKSTALASGSREDSKPKHLYLTHRVQFIHQTVKEYVQNRNDNFGLKRTQTGGSGFHYILAAAVSSNDQWADEIGLDLFEYARLANHNKNDESQRALRNSLVELERLPEIRSRAEWWLENKQIEFYNGLLFKCPPDFIVLVLALAAGLFEYVGERLREDLLKGPSLTRSNVDALLLYMATIGPKITLAQTPRREMLNFLVQQGCLIDQAMVFSFGIKFPGGAPTPLALIMRAKGRFDQDEKERVSAIAYLLDHGADPDWEMSTYDFNTYVSGETIFSVCIRQESVEIVRLFGQYGAKLPKEMIVPLRTLWQMLSTPSEVLEEVIRIMQRNYPEIDLDEKTDTTVPDKFSHQIFPISEIFWNTNTSAAVPALGTVAAMSIGMSRTFSRGYSGVAKKRLRKMKIGHHAFGAYL